MLSVFVPLAFRDKGDYALRIIFFVPLFALIGTMIFQGISTQFSSITISSESLIYRSLLGRKEIPLADLRESRMVLIISVWYFVFKTDSPGEIWIPGGDRRIMEALLRIKAERRIREIMANKPPLPTPASDTPDGGAPVAPPPGAAGR